MAQTERRKQVEKIRKKARKHLPQLLSHQHNKCHWCKCHIIIKTDIRIIPNTENNQRVKIWEYGITSIASLATIDHIVPLRISINNDISNLVASCYDCNWKRTRQKSQPKPCKCGSGLMREARQRRCGVCSLAIPPFKAKWYVVRKIEKKLDKIRNLQYDS